MAAEGIDRPAIRVLVVDDNQDSADLLAMLGEAHGFVCRSCYSGLAALGVAQDWRPDVILLDLGMPEVSGYEIASAIRTDDDLSSVVLVAVTGWGQVRDRRRTAEAGFDAHFTKPYEANELFETVRRIHAEKRTTGI
jgi:CheY-like chemotaxis protein